LWANVKHAVKFVIFIANIKNEVEFVIIIVASRRMKRIAIDIALDAIVEEPHHYQKCRRQMLVGV
jgi:hypothetical protein